MLRHTGRLTPRHFLQRAAWAHMMENGHGNKASRIFRSGLAALKFIWGGKTPQNPPLGQKFSADGELMDKSPESSFNFNGISGREKARLEYLEDVIKFQRAVDRNPNNVFAQFKLGVALGNSGDIRGALKCFDAVLKLNPHVYKAYTLRAFCKRILGDEKSAWQDMRTADLAKKRLNAPYVDLKVKEAVFQIMAESVF